MGLRKWDHIQTMLQMDRVQVEWKERFGREPDIEDVDKLYDWFEPMLMKILPDYCTPIPGVLDLVSRLRNEKIKIGSSAGYTSEMMEIVQLEAKQQGYEPDYLATSDKVPKGRPSPWMCYSNAKNLGVESMKNIIKIGDTLSDIGEGLNADTWSVGVVLGSSEMRLT